MFMLQAISFNDCVYVLTPTYLAISIYLLELAIRIRIRDPPNFGIRFSIADSDS